MRITPLRLAALLGLSWFHPGCSESTPPATTGTTVRLELLDGALIATGAADVELRTLRLGSEPPFVLVPMAGFRGLLELRTAEPLAVPHELEFIPVAERRGAPDMKIRVDVLDGGEPRELLKAAPVVVGRGGGEAQGDLLKGRVRVRLAASPAEPVTLRVSTEPFAGADLLGLADLRLRPVSEGPRPPSILLVCSGHHRADFALFDTGPTFMPKLAEFRKSAVSYPAASSGATWTLPALATLLTGRFPRQHRAGFKVRVLSAEQIKSRDLLPGRLAVPLGDHFLEVTGHDATQDTVPERLAAAGYSTALVTASPYYTAAGFVGDGFGTVLEAPGAPGRFVVDQFRRVLDSLPAEQPLFVMVHLVDCQEYQRFEFARRVANVSPYDAHRQQVRDSYGWSAKAVDEHFSALLELWERKVGLASSLVVFTADHGEHLHDPGHPHLEDALASGERELPRDLRLLAVPVLGSGNSMQESLLRVPLVIKYPDGRVEQGRDDATPVSLADLLPTLLDVAGIAASEWPEGLGGESLLRLASGGAERAFFAEFQQHGPPLASVRRGDLKLVVNGKEGTVALTRIDRAARPDGDPGEVLAPGAEQDELLDLLRRHVLESRAQSAGRLIQWDAADDPVARQLEALAGGG